MKVGRFSNSWRGNGVFISFWRVLIALRWRWHLDYIRPSGKPGYRRLYVGPVELEIRPSSKEPGRVKKILVLGSAPGASLPHDIENYFVIAANASIGAFPDLIPDVLVLNGYTLHSVKGIAPESKRKLEGRTVKHLIVIDNVPDIEALIKKSGIMYQSLEIWSRQKRADVCSYQSGIEYSGLGGNDIPSTGVTAICYALGFSADVFVSGISIQSDGHSYSKEKFKRGHVDVDGRTLSAISGRYKGIGQ
ncbi:hypothetical protein CASP1_00016 [Alcaligenes phage CASP1]|nr:hypothetical protein CASP1_00016 [Alcaligenes phage CASP1]